MLKRNGASSPGFSGGPTLRPRVRAELAAASRLAGLS